MADHSVRGGSIEKSRTGIPGEHRDSAVAPSTVQCLAGWGSVEGTSTCLGLAHLAFAGKL
jgi:hypothetical protein